MLRSLSLKLIALVVLFAGIPLLLYSQFRQADEEKRNIIAENLRTQGRVIAEMLKPDLTVFSETSLEKLKGRLRQIGQEEVRIKLLFRPAAMSGVKNFFYVASSSSESMEYLSLERQELFATPVVAGLGDSCEANQPVTARFRNPDGAEEILTSIVPVLHEDGCWLVLTSSIIDEPAESLLLGGAYWKQPEVVLAALVLLISALFVLSLFMNIWLGLRRFARLAREISANASEAGSFAERNQVPELESVAHDFDRLVGSLRRSAQVVRELAEENTHAIKGLLAVIAQSIEPLKRAGPLLDARGRRALELIENSVERLDEIVSQARDIETAEADLMAASRSPVDVMALLSTLAAAYRGQAAEREVEVAVSGTGRAMVVANPAQLETAIENIIDNALSFSPRGGRVTIDVERKDRQVVIRITDDGPGVAESDLERIFDRSVSLRPAVECGDGVGAAAVKHYGIGLWIARRNITHADGALRAFNSSRGLSLEITLPAHAG